MMTVEELRRAREESANVAYLTFAKHIRADKLGIFCFFEGKDSPYYSLRIKTIFQGNYFPINCSGKAKVIKVYELIHYHREYDQFLKGFFVDRDFDFPILNEKIFETPCYSVENLYTSESVFREILKSELGFTEVEEEFEKCVNLYRKLQSEFHEAIMLFNAWYACLIFLRNTTNQQTGINLSNSIPKDLVEISLEGITSNYDISKLKSKFPNSLEIDNQILEDKILAFSLQEKGRIFRGKYEIEFMLKILDLLIQDANTNRKYTSKNIKYHIIHSQVISQFSQYAETPPELVAYIQKIIS